MWYPVPFSVALWVILTVVIFLWWYWWKPKIERHSPQFTVWDLSASLTSINQSRFLEVHLQFHLQVGIEPSVTHLSTEVRVEWNVKWNTQRKHIMYKPSFLKMWRNMLHVQDSGVKCFFSITGTVSCGAPTNGPVFLDPFSVCKPSQSALSSVLPLMSSHGSQHDAFYMRRALCLEHTAWPLRMLYKKSLVM